MFGMGDGDKMTSETMVALRVGNGSATTVGDVGKSRDGDG